MESRYAHEKLWQAVHVLATGSGDIQGRLASAAIYLIRLRPEEDFNSEEHQETFKGIVHDLTKVPALADEGRIQATAAKMSDEEGRRLAGAILSLYTEMKGGI